MGIRTKLVAIFILIKALPLAALAVVAFVGLAALGKGISSDIDDLSAASSQAIGRMSSVSVNESVKALDRKATEEIERLTVITAERVADFLRDRDKDILAAAKLPATEEAYADFLADKAGLLTVVPQWKISEDGKGWTSVFSPKSGKRGLVAGNPDNGKDFHHRPKDGSRFRKAPLYVEMTFVGPDGQELVKVTTSDLVSSERKNVSIKSNTFCGAETYFPELPDAKREIYVSEVVGAHVPTPIIGTYSPEAAARAGIQFEPEKAGFAGKENPVGKRFRGIIRWASPVFRNGKLAGWVTLALDHDHVMEFTDHLVPTPERRTEMPDAGSGNYAFMWDHLGRNISHPRDYFIVGYDPETGEPSVPWMEKSRYEDMALSGKSFGEWSKTAETMVGQSLKKRPEPSLTEKGNVGLDCRFLDFAPQCEGWMRLTSDGGSGSFVIFWSGLWKLTTAAAIPYHTGRYAGPRGFGFVTIGANVEEFHKAAADTGRKLAAMASDFEKSLVRSSETMKKRADRQLEETGRDITLSTAAMILGVVLVAILMASSLTRRLTEITSGFKSFRDTGKAGNIPVRSGDELGELASAFNDMTCQISALLTARERERENYRTFFDKAPEGIFRSTADGALIEANASMAHLFGYENPESMLAAVRNTGLDLYAVPGKRREILATLERDGCLKDFVFDGKRKDGEPVKIRLSAHWVTLDDGDRYLEGMCIDVTRREWAMEAMAEAKEKAEELSAAKSGFLSMVSHEFRTPLTSVVGFAKLSRKLLVKAMERGCGHVGGCVGDPVKIMGNIDIIVSEGERLSVLINDVLDLSKLEAGAMEMKISRVDMLDIVKRSMTATDALFRQSGTDILISVRPGTMVQGDHDRLVQVCVNLLSNAAKFAPLGNVEVTAARSGDMVEVSVIDNGIGIPAEHLETVFDKFRQLGDTMTDKPRGTGLGLPICREVVELHGGHIRAMVNESGGTILAFTVPAA